MSYDKTEQNVQKLQTKILLVAERKDLRFPELIINFIERKIQRLQ